MKLENYDPKKKAIGIDKLSHVPVRIKKNEVRRKPDWIKIKLSTENKVQPLKNLIKHNRLVTVCEEASCPNLTECYSHGIATFMIMGDKCTRRCTFCDVGHGRPDPLNKDEPTQLANTIKSMSLSFVVITSVDRDDLRDGGASHFVSCISEIRKTNPNIKVEVLVPDFRGRMEKALSLLEKEPPDVFNHNIETIPRLYKIIRPGSDYLWSLKLLKKFKEKFPKVPTKSGIMVGLGETKSEVLNTMQDMRDCNIDMVTVGQYLQPTKHHSPVMRYVHPEEFNEYAEFGKSIGFSNVASGPLVRSSYHADKQAESKRL